MSIKEITPGELDTEKFIEEQVGKIKETVGDGIAINALSGGVDSSVVTLLGHKALGDKLRTVFIDHGLMREGEPQMVADVFAGLGVKVEVVDARKEFFAALKGITDPEEKRKIGITQTFYRDVFGKMVKESGATFLLQGTILTDVDETMAGIKAQHNVLAQMGIDTKEAYGYTVIEPVIQLRKPGVRKVARAIGLPESLSERPPFPGPALTARIVGEATPERVELVRKATVITEEALADVDAFQCMAILHEDRVTGIRDGERDFGLQIEVRCWATKDAVTAKPVRVPWEILEKLADRLCAEVPGVVSVTYGIAKKPPSTMEVV